MPRVPGMAQYLLFISSRNRVHLLRTLWLITSPLARNMLSDLRES